MNLVALTLGFCNWRTWEHSLGHLYPDHLRGWRHVFADCHYPLNRAENAARVRELAAVHGIELVDLGRDRGLAGNFNAVASHLGLDQPNTYLAGIDPDAWVHGPADTLMKALRLLEAQPSLAWVSLELPRTREAMRFQLGGRMCRYGATGLEYFQPSHNSVDAIDITVWRGSFLHATGMQAGAGKTWYGENEWAMARAAYALGMTFAYLMGGHVSACTREFNDPEYQAWKAAHVAGDARGFAEWLADNGRGR